MKPKSPQKQLEDYRKQVIKDSRTQQNLFLKSIKENRKFKFQLITISGGTLSIFVALKVGGVVSLFIKLGFAFLGLSLVAGVFSLFLELCSGGYLVIFKAEGQHLGSKIALDFFEKFTSLDISFDKEALSAQKAIIKDFKTHLGQKMRIPKILHDKLGLTADRIEYSQLILFLLGIVFISIGIFF